VTSTTIGVDIDVVPLRSLSHDPNSTHANDVEDWNGFGI